MSDGTVVLGKVKIRYRQAKKRGKPFAETTAILDQRAEGSTVPESLAKAAGIKPEAEYSDPEEGIFAGYLQADALVKGHWMRLQDNAGEENVLVTWFQGVETGSVFGQEVLEYTRQTTIVAVPDE